MCKRLRSRIGSALGQATSEYVVIVGMMGALSLFVAERLGLSFKDVFKRAAGQILSVVTGFPSLF